MTTKNKEMTDEEQEEKLISVLEIFEAQTRRDTGVDRLMGGFVEADVFDQDENYIDIELKWGIQNDRENEVHTEQYKLSVEELRNGKSLFDIAKKIESS